MVSNSSGKQTVDITGLKADSYLCITGAQDNGKYMVEEVTEEMETAIGAIQNSRFKIQNGGEVYDLSGRKIDSSLFTLHSSFKYYILNGKKVVF